MDLDSLCMGCMGQKGNQDVCSSCGWNADSPPESPLHLPFGTLLNEKYLLGRVLGQGGFGITYLAFDTLLERKLAVKEYFPRDYCYRDKGDSSISIYSGSTRSQYDYGLNKFLDEAKTLAMFDGHPNIIAVKDFFKVNGTAYLVMNYLEGYTLKQYLQHKNAVLSFKQTLDIMLPVMDALSYVHEEGLLHRDVSPDNIFITSKGTIILLDFGAARHALGENAKNLSIILKAGYAPEEQYRSSGKQGPWTDIYAVAATMYQVITGQMPPESLDRLDTDHLVSPSRLGADITSPAESALLKALAVKSRDRYQTINDFREALWNDTPIQKEIELESDNADESLSEPAIENNSFVDPATADVSMHSIEDLPDIKITIGRNPDNDFVITDEIVSRFHANIYRYSGKWYLEDLNSTGGTFLNGLLINGQVELLPGATIKIGNTILSFDGKQILDGHGFSVSFSAGYESSISFSQENDTFSAHQASGDRHYHHAVAQQNMNTGTGTGKSRALITTAALVVIGGAVFIYTQFGLSQTDQVESTSAAEEVVIDVQEEEAEQENLVEEILQTGTIEYRGGQYTGELKDGLPHGEGVWVLATGSSSLSYSGISSSGEQRYEGQWVDGNKHGQGRMVMPSGVVQTGLWENDSYIGPAGN